MTETIKDKLSKPMFQNAAVICLCFLLTSTGYLAWTYHVIDLLPPAASEAVTLSAAYFLQAAGVGVFMLFLYRGYGWMERMVYIALTLYLICLAPAVFGTSLTIVLFFGLLGNLLCGFLAGFYLYHLTVRTDGSSIAVTLGTGYGVSILVSWILSLIGRGSLYRSKGILLACLVLTAAVITWIRKTLPAPSEESDGKKVEASRHAAMENDVRCAENHETTKLYIPEEWGFRKFALLAGGLILLFSVVNSCGFGFPSADLKVGISVEFSRMFYAAGLLIAGFVTDKNRKYGAVCALTCLVIPFLMLALNGEPVSLMIFWALSYFSFGFYTVHRIILFSDLSRENDVIWLCGFGLLIGRIGDALGEILILAFSEHLSILLMITALLFMGAIVLFLHMYHFLYLSETMLRDDRQEKFDQFCAKYDLSVREREVLRLLLQERNNQQIAEELSVSESTVKFHIHNLLQKTGCRNRVALLSDYSLSGNS